MNIELCKNCNHSCIVYFYDERNENKNEIICGVKHKVCTSVKEWNELLERENKYGSSYKVFKHEHGVWVCTKNGRGYDYCPNNQDFVYIKLNKSCPYYIEHELSDWNY